MTSYGHLSNLSQDRIETGKGEGMCHLSGRGHPRTCEKLWAGAPRWTMCLRASLAGVGPPQAQGASPGWEGAGCPSALLCCAGAWGSTLHLHLTQSLHRGLLSCVSDISCANPKPTAAQNTGPERTAPSLPVSKGTSHASDAEPWALGQFGTDPLLWAWLHLADQELQQRLASRRPITMQPATW